MCLPLLFRIQWQGHSSWVCLRSWWCAGAGSMLMAKVCACIVVHVILLISNPPWHMYKAVLSSWFNMSICYCFLPSFCLFVWRSVCLCVCLSDCLSLWLTVCLSVCLSIHWKIWNYTYKIDPHQTSARADCVAWLVFTTDSRVERLRILLTASNSCHCIVCTLSSLIQPSAGFPRKWTPPSQ